MKSMQVAPAPSGQPLRLTLFSGSNHYFDGDVLFITPPAVASAELTAFWNAEDDLESILARPRPPNWAKRPTAVLLAPSSQGRTEPVCEFQRAEPNF